MQTRIIGGVKYHVLSKTEYRIYIGLLITIPVAIIVVIAFA